MDNQNHNMEKIRSNVLLVVSIFAIFIIGIVAIINRPVITDVDFSQSGYYVTQSTAPRRSSAVNESYESYISMRSVECPGVGVNMVPIGHVLNTNGVYAGRKHDIAFTNFLFTSNELYNDTYTYQQINRGTVASLLRLNTTLAEIKECTYEEMIQQAPSYKGDANGVYQCYEIIAPFTFKYDNSNMESERNKIVIYNTSRTCRITIEDVDNWFCAGLPGQEMTVDSRMSEGPITWVQHGQKHLSFIGNHSNSIKKGGSAGELLGYGSANTKFTIEIHTDAGWQTTNWKQIYGI